MAERIWTEALNEEDLAFLRRFLLASGSLKDLASDYGVSYPTIRLRLDRVIAKVQAFEGATALSKFEQTVRTLIADGKLDPKVGSTLLNAHREESSSGAGSTK